MTLTLGFSPCPNDTFIFDALVNNKIDTEGLAFDVVLDDVQALNLMAAQNKLDITKLSFPALFTATRYYTMLDAGAALGKGVGPLLVARNAMQKSDVANRTIAIPGENTTANFLLRYAFPTAGKKVPMLFSAIEDAVLSKEVDLGVIIHENRFTYQQKGLYKVCDLGEVWEEEENLPIPLGCIAVKKSLPAGLQQQVEKLIKKSLQYAWAQYPQLPAYVIENAQAMEEEVMRQHIQLYVNNYSLHLGDEGRKAIEQLLAVYNSKSNSSISAKDLFI